jgi:hypothetical protein
MSEEEYVCGTCQLCVQGPDEQDMCEDDFVDGEYVLKPLPDARTCEKWKGWGL